MMHVKNLAVFDLDGTLWKGNSHYEILNAYFKTNFYKSFLFRVFSHFFKNFAYRFICKKYDELPKTFASSFLLAFAPEIVSLLRQKQKDGFLCVIVSNAPLEIIVGASKRLDVPYLKAPIGHKKEILDKNYSYETLFVCTDNIEDIDLIEASNERKIIFTKNNSDFFEKKGFVKNE